MHENLEHFVLSGTPILAIAQSYVENASSSEIKNFKLTSTAFNHALNMFRKKLTLKSNLITTQNAEALNKYSSTLKSLENFRLMRTRTDNSQAQIILLSKVLQKWPAMKNLSLNLRENNVILDEIKALAIALEHLKHLEALELDLSWNNIDADGARALETSLEKLTRLKFLSLHLSGNNIRADGIEALARAFQKLKQLESLGMDISYNNINDDGALFLETLLAQFTHLKSLSLHLTQNNVRANGIKALARAFQNLKHLKILELDICLNDIHTTEEGALARVFEPLTGLTKLSIDLSSNNISTAEIEKLLIALRKLTSLQSLSLKMRWNEIGSESFIMSLEKTLNQLHNHHLIDLYLELSHNPIHLPIDLIDNLSTFTKLKKLKLNLENSQISTIEASYLITKLARLNNLTSLWLELQGNNLGIDGKEDFNTALKKLPKNLEALSLSLNNNPIDDTTVEALSLGVSTLASLTELQLDLQQTRAGDNGAMRFITALENLKKLELFAFRLDSITEGEIGGFTDEGRKAFNTAAIEILPALAGKKFQQNIATLWF